MPATAQAPALPVLGFCGYSGAGKTTLLEKLLPLLREQGRRIALIKHAHHHFDIDHPGKDSMRLRDAGADQVVITSARRIAIIRERQTEDGEPDLAEALEQIDPRRCDLVIVEGFKQAAIPKIELLRDADAMPLYPRDPHIVALVSDRPEERASGLPCFPFAAIGDIGAFIGDWLRSQTPGLN